MHPREMAGKMNFRRSPASRFRLAHHKHSGHAGTFMALNVTEELETTILWRIENKCVGSTRLKRLGFQTLSRDMKCVANAALVGDSYTDPLSWLNADV